MKLKRLAIMFCIILLTIASVSVFNVVNAADGSKYLGIVMLRQSGFGYKAIEKNIWKIVEANDSSGSVVNYDNMIYCIKGGPGFGSETYTEEIKHYTKYFDMKDPDSIPSPYVDALPDTNSNTYKALLWILEHAYVIPKANATSEEIEQAKEYKELLLKNVKEHDEDNYGYLDAEANGEIDLTDEDIDVVQQLAIWHFTNEGDQYDVEVKSPYKTFELALNSIKGDAGSGYSPLNSEVGDGADNGIVRAASAVALYRYLVDKAEEAAPNYEVTEASVPYQFADLVQNVTTVGNNYKIGPFKIEKISDTEATLEWKITLKDGSTLENAHFENASGKTIDDLNDVIGEEFYIVTPTTTDISQITLSISGVYYNTKIEYWAMENPENEQPVAIVEREKIPYEDSVTVTYEPEPEPEPEVFDLALRKFIVSINGVSPEASRVPQISDDTLADLKDGRITTAEKVHPKNPLTVETGDSVIYTIRVYNEGDIDGIVTEITDYLPDGLKLKANSSVNSKYGWKDNGDGKITTDYLKGEVLKAFDGKTLDYRDVQIECEVVASVSDTDTKLKNVAEITGATDSEGEDMTDRDSTPDNVDVPGYGNESQEDDDDFEDLIILGKYFDLALRKFIISINGTAPTESREPVVDTTPLTSGSSTTANKVHPKNPLVVETGDSVVYTIRVYNEGQIDGIVTEITDYLPDGLKLKADSDINEKYGWVDNGDGTITTNYLTGQILDAFDGKTLDYLDVQIECEVVATASDTDINLKNIAEITGATDSEGNDIPEDLIDRDSTPDNVDVPGYGDESQEDDDDFEDLVILGKYFDLSLRKFIIQVNDTELKDEDGKYLREPVVDTTPLTSGSDTTAIYKHPKDPVEVAIGDEVIYTIRVYNEGQIDGYVYEITDNLPANLEFVNDEFNAKYGWKISGDGRTVTTDITSPDTEYSASRDTIYADRKDGEDKVILNAFDGTTLDYIDVQIKCKVKDTAKAEEKLTNIAEITDFTDSNKEEVTDRDSDEDNVTIPSDDTLPNYKDDEINRGDEYIPGQEDDDDFEKLVIEKFDLALRKFITGVNENEVTDRYPVFNNDNGKYTYTHTKDPILVKTGDIVTYTIRVYNEGDIAGYAEEVKDDLPEGLEFLPDNTTNINYRWVMYDAEGNVTENVADAVSIRTDYLSKAQEDETGRDNLIDAFDPDTMQEPDYKEVRIAFKVIEPNTSDRVLVNIAEISEDANEDGEPVDDVDSTPDNDKPEEDDIDYEQVEVTYFDLALRKFITGVNDESITNRVPVFSNEDGKYTYTHPKDPVEVSNGDIVIYTIRVYNEGPQAGYAEEVKDDLPEGLEFLPDNEINTEYRWVMYDAEGNVTENVADAETIRTDYLSKAQEDETGRDNLLQGFDPDTMTQPDYKDVKIAFKVTEPNTSDRILINTAEISEDSDEDGEPVDDIDSTPDNDEPEEDDIDIEKVKVTYFDLALEKIITKVTMELDGETYVDETGHKFGEKPEEVVKVELGNHKIEDSVLKFTYKIRITNEGNKAGYAYEVKDYIPEGLEFVAEDNDDSWTLSEDGKTVTTDQLKDTLLQPGESADVEITLRWINGQTNLGVKTNWAEISEDSDDDIDSTPDNNDKDEDDIDDAEVVLSIVTGVGEHYIGVIISVLVILAGGIILIKKFVLTK